MLKTTIKKKSNPRGRPPLPKGKALGAVVPIRFTDSEKMVFEKMAKKEGLTLSQWVRKSLNSSANK